MALLRYASSCLRPSGKMLTELRRSGIMAALLQEIVSVYPLLSPPALTAHASNRVCNALALLQCVASHSDTRQLFLNGLCLSRILSALCSFQIRQPIYHCFSTPSSIRHRRRVLSNTCVSHPWALLGP